MNGSADFTLFPAIDLRQGQVVRLQQGDPDQRTTFSADPAAVAERWLTAGARWLHVVNLDGAFDEADQANQRALQAILRTADRYQGQVQFGGGIRSLPAIETALEMGVRRVVLGTVLAEQPEILSQALDRWGMERVAAGVDARRGIVQVHGWQRASQLQATELATRLAQTDLKWMIYTDIARDGMRSGLNLSATVELALRTGLAVVASGGVRDLEEIQAARSAGLAGVIIGRALYEGALDLQQALALVA